MDKRFGPCCRVLLGLNLNYGQFHYRNDEEKSKSSRQDPIQRDPTIKVKLYSSLNNFFCNYDNNDDFAVAVLDLYENFMSAKE